MSKIIKSSIKEIKNCETLRVFKYDNSKNYYVSFYIGRHLHDSGMYITSLKVKDSKVAVKLAKDIWKKFDKDSIAFAGRYLSLVSDEFKPDLVLQSCFVHLCKELEESLSYL